MIKVVNISPGPRGLNTKAGPVMLAPGQGANVDLSEGELAASERTGWFTFEGQSAAETDPAYAAMTEDELQALLKDRGVAVDGRWGHDRLVAEAKKTQSAA